MERYCMQMVSVRACMRMQRVGVRMGRAAGWHVRADKACGRVACVCGCGAWTR